MARAALGWGVRDLATKANVGTTTVTRFENGQGMPIPATIAAMQRAFEGAGIVFSDDGGVRPEAACLHAEKALEDQK